MLRQMHIELRWILNSNAFETPRKKDKCVTDLGEDENGLSKTLLAKPTNVYILYEMPEKITTGPRKGKLSSMNININAQLLEIMLSNRQYCFIFELLYRNFAEEWQVVEPIVDTYDYKSFVLKIFDDNDPWLKIPLKFETLKITLIDMISKKGNSYAEMARLPWYLGIFF